jgi:hypothetical protein
MSDDIYSKVEALRIAAYTPPDYDDEEVEEPDLDYLRAQEKWADMGRGGL